MKKTSPKERFSIYQNLVFRLLQGDTLTNIEQDEFLEIQKRSIENNVLLKLEPFFRTSQLLSPQERTQFAGLLIDIYKNINNELVKAFVEKLKLPETRHQKIEYGSDNLSKKTKYFRQKWHNRDQQKFDECEKNCYDDLQTHLKNPNYSPQAHIAFNIAVAEYIDNQGNTAYVMRASVHNTAFPPNGKHSEKRILEFLEANNIPYANVIRWYSEIQPCNDPLHACREKLFENTPNAPISYTFEYDKDKIGVSNHKQFMNNKLFL